jgi:hypothetical protein
VAEPKPAPKENLRPLPNLWLKDVLAQPQLKHDWFACLVYAKLAERIGNSSEGQFGAARCWFIALDECQELGDPVFHGVFLTEKGGFGFLNHEHMARLYNGVAFLGTMTSAIEGIEVSLLGVGLAAGGEIVFIISDGYQARFDVPEPTLANLLARLRESGALVFSATEALATREPLEVAWTARVTQANPEEPQALESTQARPGANATALG